MQRTHLITMCRKSLSSTVEGSVPCMTACDMGLYGAALCIDLHHGSFICAELM